MILGLSTYVRYLTFLGFQIFWDKTMAQSKPITLMNSKEPTSVLQVNESINGQSHNLYNGHEYINYKQLGTEYPYFSSPEWLYGTLEYDGVFYSKVKIRFNLEIQALIILNPENGNAIRLIDELITEFTLNEHKFININVNETNQSFIKNGYYEIVHTGPLCLLAKRSKKLIKKIERSVIQWEYLESVNYVLFKDDSYYTIRNLRDLNKHLELPKTEVKEILHLSKSRQDALVNLMAFYYKTQSTK